MSLPSGKSLRSSLLPFRCSRLENTSYSSLLRENGHADSDIYYSISGNFAIHIGRTGGPGTVLHNAQISRFFWLLFSRLYPKKKRFEGIDFHVHWQGKRIAEGFMIKLAPPNTALSSLE